MYSGNIKYYLLIFSLIVFNNCNDRNNPYDIWSINYDKGVFPDSLFNFISINSEYNDMNIGPPPSINHQFSLFISSDRNSGSDFDIFQFICYSEFNQTNGNYKIDASNQQPLTTIINSTGNEYGPLLINTGAQIFRNSENDSLLYTGNLDNMADDTSWILSYSSDSSSSNGTLDIWFARLVIIDSTEDSGTAEVVTIKAKNINSEANDCYLTFGPDNKGYFCSDRYGNFDIYSFQLPINFNTSDIITFLSDSSNNVTVTRVNAVCSSYDDKCPYIYDTSMVFVSNRAEGYGGYDILRAELSDNEWSDPVIEGPKINSQSNEYRPVLIGLSDFNNRLLMFSSDREGGKGGFDIYYTGID